jgi:teichuronic acid biosynthesis protein TuaE
MTAAVVAERITGTRSLPPLVAGAGVAAAVGAAAALHPLLAPGLVAVGLVAVLFIVRPLVALGVALLSSAFAPEFYEGLAQHGSAIVRANRLLVLVALVAILARRGLRDRVVPLPLVAYGGLFVLTFTVASRHPGLTPSKAVFALATLTIGWLATQVRWRRNEVRPVLFMLAALPVTSVVAGLALGAARVRPLTMQEYTGVDRLQGATIPAYLGFLGTAGAAAATALLLLPRDAGGATRRQRPWAAFAIVAGVACVALSGTRGALIAVLVVVAPAAWRSVHGGHGSRRAGRTVRATVLVAALVAAGFAVTPMLIERTRTDETSSALDTSGRAEAWTFYLREVSEAPELGRGLGAGPVIGEEGFGRLRGDFRGTHNEYVRLFVEGGWLGLVLVVGAVAVHLGSHLRRTPRHVRSGAITLVVVFAAYSAVDNTISNFHFFLPFGLLVGIYSMAPATAEELPS